MVTYFHVTMTVADPGFPVGGTPIPLGTPTFDAGAFSSKYIDLCQYERIGSDLEGGGSINESG